MIVTYPTPIKPDYDGTYSYYTGLANKLKDNPPGITFNPVDMNGRFEFLKAKFYGPGIVHNPTSHYYLGRKQPIPTVLTMMDAVPFTSSKLLTWKTQLYHRVIGRKAMDNADIIITISKNSLEDFVKIGIPREKLRLVYPGVNDIFFGYPVMNQASVEQRFKITSPYILYVGGFNPRKNVDRLIKTFIQAKNRYGFYHQLVLAGCRGWDNQTTWDLISRYHKDVVAVRNPDVYEIHALMSYADCFVFPSLYEGFGLPIAEAMASRCPVLCSNRASMPEVMGDVGITFDPENMTPDLFEFTSDYVPSLDMLRVPLWYRAVEMFGWKKAAKETVGVYGELSG